MEKVRREDSDKEPREDNVTTRHPSQAEGAEETVDEALENDELAPREPPD
jgi:hypothetical protein